MMTWSPCKWHLEGVRDRLGEVTIDIVARIDGPDRYAVRRGGSCLSKEGFFEWEMQPSSRTDEFFKRCRYNTFNEAAKVYEDWLVFEQSRSV
jgi:hypothetical protein